MDPRLFYRDRTASLTARLRRLRARRNGVTLLKVGAFVLLVYTVYLLFAAWGGWSGGLFLAVCALFAGLTVLDGRLVTEMRLSQEGIACCQADLRCLDGDPEGLPTGERYKDPAHPYSFDLDIFGEDSLFQRIDRTVTDGGADRLATWLLNPCRTAGEIVSRQEAAAELAGRPDWCLRFRTLGRLHSTGGSEAALLQRWREEPPFFRRRVLLKGMYVLNGLTLGSWLLTLFGWMPAPVSFLLSMTQLLWVGICLQRVNALHRRLGRLFRALDNYFPLIRSVREPDFASSRMREVREALFGPGRDALAAFRSLDRILSGLDQRGNVLLALTLNGLYMRDLHTVARLDRWKERYGEVLADWVDAVTETDALISLAVYRFGHPAYAVPVPAGDCLLDAQGLGHPLLPEEGRVDNDLRVEGLHDLYIVTGANMAGKSTFLRTVGTNLVLALSGNVVCARTFSFLPMGLFTSMRTTDNLSKGTSYFHAELLRLKALTEAAEREERLFIILDEMLKGTNSRDKLNGSLKFLERLLSRPVAGLVATHDLALGELAERYPRHFHNVCFEIDEAGDGIHSDYRLRPGVSRNMNASLLLERMGLI